MARPAHPFPPGTRVRHVGRTWSRAAIATVVSAKSASRGDYEYEVEVDPEATDWPTAGRRTWWASYATREAPGA